MNELVGKTLATITNGGNAIYFEAVTGEHWIMHHVQDCCESVYIEDIVGDLDDLVGSPILMAECECNSDNPKDVDYPDDSHTWTFYKLATAKGYVTIRWYGSSNGYYSETVSFERTNS